MKHILYLSILILPITSFACLNKISPSDLSKVIASNNPFDADTLSYKGEDGICYDGIDLRVADVVDGVLVESDTKKANLAIDRQSKEDALGAQEAARKQALKDIRDLPALQDSATLLDVIKRSNKIRGALKDILKAEINKAE